ncbi:cytochrome P450 [Phaeosphaeriaceae sp. PMI808]|nr:cytochrome P450 [Phaeosphaeriaceae sp. PMI808]
MYLANSSSFIIGPLSVVTLHEFVLRQVEKYTLRHWQLSPFVPPWLYIGTYRTFFHPLRTFPGPFKARLSKWWSIKQTLDSSRRLHRTQQQMQKQYGDFVRTNTIPALYGVQSKITKRHFYDLLEKPLHLNRDKQLHRRRRRVWDNAFKASLLDNKKNTKPNFTSHLIKSTSNGPKGRVLLYIESRLIISAGSETVITAMVFIFIHLATNPKHLRAVCEEFRADASTYNCQQSLPVLDAIINESMRMWPSVFFAQQRVIPPEGLNINGRFIPGNMIVQILPFALHRDPRNFVKPDEFIPEQWLDQPQLIPQKYAFFPFMAGLYSCTGH